MKFSDFLEYDIALYLQQAGLCDLFSIESKQVYYPTLIYLFFTNLTYEDDEANETYLITYENHRN